MDALQSSAARALQTILRDQPTTPAKVSFAWQIAAGPALGRAAIVAWTGDGLLRVKPSSDAWRREIRHARPLITARLRELLGPDTVRAIVLDGESGSQPER